MEEDHENWGNGGAAPRGVYRQEARGSDRRWCEWRFDGI